MPPGRPPGDTGDMPELWYRALLRAATAIYYRRVRVVRLAAVAIDQRPVLLVGLHRNGAVDGMLYKSVFPRAVFLISRQLVRRWFGRLFFTGIPVTRDKDEDESGSRRDNSGALAVAVEHLVAGGHLFVFPEGTSDLGPRHLPFKPGAARILAAALARGVTPLVIPVGIFYESAPTFRSDVCIVAGAPIDVTLPASTEDQRGRLAALMARITASLEAIAVEANDAHALLRIETLAAIADEEMGEARWRAQKMLMECPLSARLDEHWRRLSADIASRRTAVDRAGIPRFSRHGALWNGAWLVVQMLIVVLAALANPVPVGGAWRAGKRLATERNTIALWRILIGAPLAVAWLAAMIVFAFATRRLWVLPAYLTITALGLVAYPELCTRWPKLRNAFGRRTARNDAAAIGGWMRASAAGRSHD